MNKPARIVLLNGVGSVGKTSIAKALQTITRETFLHVQMDVFLEMLPEGKLNDPDCFTFESHLENGKPSVVIRSGPTGNRLMRGMRQAIAAMARQGNDLIVDDVLLGNDAAHYAEILAAFEVFRVGVFAPLDVLEARERQRGDRLIGLARWQYDRVHQGIAYDLEIDASRATPLDCARRIKERLSL
ncbi:chloramphenicol phosphotransferase CPT family protein [Dongia soli]|uniref:Chloramphenicol phosphotransferase n=1 Tax=Dongia soli TaxID=600628 RepID=A0ABU5ECA4_9PROT|nr:chloramphenicol phosphotransferase [Dongia soli]MDY0883419.1 chloramphenicol phosphotransferase [Dongia soli]